MFKPLEVSPPSTHAWLMLVDIVTLILLVFFLNPNNYAFNIILLFSFMVNNPPSFPWFFQCWPMNLNMEENSLIFNDMFT